MVLDAVEFLLKDGRKAVLRSPEVADAQGMIDYLYASAKETDFILRTPNECKKYTLEYEIGVIENMRNSPLQAVFVCEVDGKIAGNCNIVFNNKIKIRHRAAVAIALMKEFWNLGIGTRMFEEMIRTAKSVPEVSMIELDFVEGNNRARALYEKMGFKITGVRPKAIKLEDGTYLDEYMMIKEL